VGAGPLLALLDDPETTDILVNGPDSVWTDGPGGLRRAAIRLGDRARLRALAAALVAVGGGRLDDACPAADVRLPGNLRLHAILPPIARDGPLLSLRVLRRRAFTVAELAARGTLPGPVAGVVHGLVAARANLLVSGATGAGKTTLLSSLLGLVPPTERIVVIEEAAEIASPHPHLVRLEARRANTEGRGEFTLTELVRQAMRMRPDRIVLGECRGAEVREVLTALNTGHAGSAATIHANAAADVPARLAALGALAGMDAPAVAAQTAAAIDAIVHVGRAARAGEGAGVRQVREIALVAASDGGRLAAVPALTVGEGTAKKGPAWDRLERLVGR
jgi:pilus assembly protein CpaF